MIVYPIKFKPILKEKNWGGNKLNSVLGKETNKNNVGERWKILDVNDNISIVSNRNYAGNSLKELIAIVLYKYCVNFGNCCAIHYSI
ncbi:MAG: mannose-6-phosphate isomerase [Polaribacter sp.]|jgi:mannose-6-phosphate isomerase